MAKNDKNTKCVDYQLQVARQYGAPLDKYSLFYSMAEAEQYAANSPLAYAGQLVSVVNETDKTVDIYKINVDGTLGGLGAQVDTSQFVKKSGDTITGDLTVQEEISTTSLYIYNKKGGNATLSVSDNTLNVGGRLYADNIEGSEIVAYQTVAGDAIVGRSQVHGRGEGVYDNDERVYSPNNKQPFLPIKDTRNTELPNDANVMYSFFTNYAMPDSNWWQGIRLQGWTYNVYNFLELIGQADNGTDFNKPLYVRSGKGTQKGSLRKIYDSENKPTAADVGAVPTTRTVNGKALSSNISLSAADLGALAKDNGEQICNGYLGSNKGLRSYGGSIFSVLHSYWYNGTCKAGFYWKDYTLTFGKIGDGTTISGAYEYPVNFDCELHEKGVRVYSPNNPPPSSGGSGNSLVTLIFRVNTSMSSESYEGYITLKWIRSRITAETKSMSIASEIATKLNDLGLIGVGITSINPMLSREPSIGNTYNVFKLLHSIEGIGNNPTELKFKTFSPSTTSAPSMTFTSGVVTYAYLIVEDIP